MARRLLSCRRGSVMVEFAILVPVFLALVLGGIEFARAMYMRQNMQFAVEEASRWALVNTTATATAISAHALSSFGNKDKTVLFTTVIDGSGVTVSGSYAFNFLVSGLLPDGIFTLTAKSRVPR